MVFIETLTDPRLTPYRNLKDRDLARDGNRFIAESEHIVRRLLASDFPVESVLVAQRRADEFSLIIRANIPLYVVPDDLIHEIIGFKFHSGVIACGLRKPPVPLEQLLPPIDRTSTIVICPELISHENLGSLIRICNAFAVDAMILGERCCNPFYRQSIRVSMGTVFAQPIAISHEIVNDLTRLRNEFGYDLFATVLHDDADPLHTIHRPRRAAILFGNEAQGLSPQEIAACDHRITIPMSRGTDSLNVHVAAGIFLYHFAK
jgi:tRNA G18 (ribose-2'-O)-methylase SpoU